MNTVASLRSPLREPVGRVRGARKSRGNVDNKVFSLIARRARDLRGARGGAQDSDPVLGIPLSALKMLGNVHICSHRTSPMCI